MNNESKTHQPLGIATSMEEKPLRFKLWGLFLEFIGPYGSLLWTLLFLWIAVPYLLEWFAVAARKLIG